MEFEPNRSSVEHCSHSRLACDWASITFSLKWCSDAEDA